MQVKASPAIHQIEELKKENEILRQELENLKQSKQAGDTLRNEHDILEAVIDNIGIGFIVADMEGNILSFNKSALAMHEFPSQKEMLSRLELYTKEFELVYPDGKTVPFEKWPLAMAIKGEYFREFKTKLIRHKTGSYRYVSYSTVPVYNSTGKPMLIVITMTDLTEIHERTEALQESEQRYNSLFNNTTLGIAHCRTITNEHGEPVDYEIIRINDAYSGITGLKREDVEGKTAREVFPGIENFSFDYIGNYGKVALQGGELNFETFFEPLDQWLSIYVYSPKKGEFTAIFSDISKRKAAEKDSLMRSTEIEAILSCIADGVVVYDREGRITRSNEAAEKLLKLRNEEKSLSISDRVPLRYKVYSEDGHLMTPEEMPAYRAAVAGETVSHQPILIQVEGESYWINMSAAPLIVSGRHTGGVISLSDITRIKEIEKNMELEHELLERNEQRLQAMFNNVAIGIVEVDTNDRIISMNDSTCKILGYSRRELIGKSVSEITSPEDRQRSDEMNSRLHRGDFDVFDYEKRYMRYDGTPLWVHVTVSAVRDSHGRHLNSIGTIEDISERKNFEEELLESRQRLQGIFDNAAIGIVEVDEEGRFIAVNNRICEMLGYSREELLQKTVQDITSPEDLQYSTEMNMKLHMGEIDMFDYEKRFIKADGTRLWAHVAISAVRDQHGRHLRTIRTIEDVSALKKNEIEIKQKNEELTRFIYTVSHDLKSPLVTIKSFTSFLKESIENNDKQAQDKDIGYIQNAADKMGMLLDELLELSRIGRKEKPKTKNSMETIARLAADIVAGRIEDKKIRIQFSGPPVLLYGHKERLIQLYQNLLDNAAKFIGDQADPLIEIGAFPEDEKKGEVVLFVRDNGSGIDPRHHHKVFGLFEKLDTSQEGTGIGLALVKRIVEVHGGTVWFTSGGQGKGTTFYFRLEGTEIIK